MNRQLIVLTEKGVDNVYAALKYLPGVMKSGKSIPR
jgi:hypothetical protein